MSAPAIPHSAPHRSTLMSARASCRGSVDAIIARGHGDWAAVEVRLGDPKAGQAAIASLRRVRGKVDARQAGEPSRLIVLTAVGRAFETKDDIAVVPITLLSP